MKRMLICGLLLGGLLAGCGGKKRSLSQNVKTESPATKEASQGAYPMPEDPGRFVFVSANSPEHYIRMFSDVAKSEMRTYGIPASITLAQGLLESGFGKCAITSGSAFISAKAFRSVSFQFRKPRRGEVNR